MNELKEYFVVYATEEDVEMNGYCIFTIQKIYNNIEYYSSVEELLKKYSNSCSDYTLINFWRIGDEEND